MRFLGYQKAHSIQKYGTFCYLCHLPNYLNYNIHFKVHEKMCQIGQIWHISLKFKLLWLKNQIFYGLCKPKAIILLKIVITLENWWFDNKNKEKLVYVKFYHPVLSKNKYFGIWLLDALKGNLSPPFEKT